MFELMFYQEVNDGVTQGVISFKKEQLEGKEFSFHNVKSIFHGEDGSLSITFEDDAAITLHEQSELFSVDWVWFVLSDEANCALNEFFIVSDEDHEFLKAGGKLRDIFGEIPDDIKEV